MKSTAWRKTLQRGCYSLLSSRTGALLVLLLAVMTLNSLLHVIDRSLGTSFVCPAGTCTHDWADNVRETNAEGFMCSEPIDAVYTWVNGSDPRHIADVNRWQEIENSKGRAANSAVTHPSHPLHTDGNGRDVAVTRTVSRTMSDAWNALARRLTGPKVDTELVEQQSGRSRFEDHDELLYSLRSLERNAPWIRRVYLVTNGQVPTWLNLDDERIVVVPHAAIFPNQSHLPVFSSPAIEAHLHRIPGLSRRFLYFNDDTFLAAPTVPSDWFTPARGHRIFFSWPVPNCADGCPSNWLSDGFCDDRCNTTECDYDGGDCIGDNVKMSHQNAYRGGRPGPHFSHPGGGGGAPPPYYRDVVHNDMNCAPGCVDSWLGDKYCDSACDNPECGYDAMDCGVDKAVTSPSPKLPVFMLQYGHQNFFVGPQVTAVMVNLSAVFPTEGSKITEGYYDTPSWVRSATITQKAKAMLLTLRKDAAKFHPLLKVEITGEVSYRDEEKHEHKATVRIRFNITRVLPVDHPHTSVNNVSNNGSAHHYSVPTDSLTHVPVTGVVPSAAHTTEANVSPTSVPPSEPFSESGLRNARRPAERNRARAPTTPTDLTDDEPAARMSPNELQQAIESHQRQERKVRGAAYEHARRLQGTTLEAAEVEAMGEGDRSSSLSLDPRQPAPTVQPIVVHRRPLTPEREEELRAMKTRWLKKAIEEEQSALDEEADWQKAFEHIFVAGSATNASAEGTEEDTHQEARRRLLDMFGDSLKFGNKLLSKKFGGANRKVPSHMVHMIDKTVIEELWEMWPKEFERSSAAKFRSQTNMQYAFLHMYWMMHANKPWGDGSEFFSSMMDENGNGVIDDLELRRIALFLWEKEVPKEDLVRALLDGVAVDNHSHTATQSSSRTPQRTQTQSLVVEAAEEETAQPETLAHAARNATRATSVHPTSPHMEFQRSAHAQHPRMPYLRRRFEEDVRVLSSDYVSLVGQLVAKAARGELNGTRAAPTWSGKLTARNFHGSHLEILLKKKYENDRKRHKHEVVPDEGEVTFFMIRDNATVVQHNMDHVLFKRNKFLCINDNMNHSHPEYPKVVEVIQTMLRRIFPTPSRFELPPGERNSFTYLDEIGSVERYRRTRTLRQLRHWATTIAPGALPTLTDAQTIFPGKYRGIVTLYPLLFSLVALALLLLVSCRSLRRVLFSRRRRVVAAPGAAATPSVNYI